MKSYLTRLSLLRVCLFLLLTVPLIASLFFREPWLWMDEVLSYTLLSDPSLAHVNRAVVSGLDANPPLFVNVYWLLGHGISLHPFFLKSITIVLFGGTVVLFYQYITRLVGRPVISLVLLTGILSFTFLNFVLSTQIRTYALYMLICVAFALSAHRLITTPNNLGRLVWHVLLGFALMMSHNVGLFYVAAVMGFFGLLWLGTGQRVYGNVGAAHLISYGLWFACWFHQFSIQAAAGKPHSWIPVPTFLSFFNTVGELLPNPSSMIEHIPALAWLPVARVGLVFALFGYVALPRLRAGWRSVVADEAFSFFLLCTIVTITTLAIALVVSLVHTSVFLSRYFWPSHLFLAYGLLYCVYALLPQWRRRLRTWPQLGTFFRAGSATIPLLTVYGMALAGFLFLQSRKVRLFPSDVVSYLTRLDPRYPVFFESADYFLPIWYYHLAPAYYLLDWPSANAKGNLLNATTDYNIINGMRLQYGVQAAMPTQRFLKGQFITHAATLPTAQAVLDTSSVRAPVDHFYVIDEASRYQFERFIQNHHVRVLRRLPIHIAGHQILECSLETGKPSAVAVNQQ